jgi:hypothetical protein
LRAEVSGEGRPRLREMRPHGSLTAAHGVRNVCNGEVGQVIQDNSSLLSPGQRTDRGTDIEDFLGVGVAPRLWRREWPPAERPPSNVERGGHDPSSCPRLTGQSPPSGQRPREGLLRSVLRERPVARKCVYGTKHCSELPLVQVWEAPVADGLLPLIMPFKSYRQRLAYRITWFRSGQKTWRIDRPSKVAVTEPVWASLSNPTWCERDAVSPPRGTARSQHQW